MTANSIATIFQFTDCHVFDPASNGSYRGINTNASLLSCLEGAAKQQKPDLLVFSGDLSHDETQASYRFLVQSIDHFFADIPCLIQAGNHDNRVAMANVFPLENCRMDDYFNFSTWRIYMLDTEVITDNWFYANVNPQVYSDLITIKNEQTVENVLVFMHYNLVNLPFRDIECGLEESDQLRQALLDCGKVRCVSSGHIHQEYHWIDRGIIYTSTPTTGLQSRLPDGSESQEWMGYKRFELFQDGSLSLDTQRVQQPVRG